MRWSIIVSNYNRISCLWIASDKIYTLNFFLISSNRFDFVT